MDWAVFLKAGFEFLNTPIGITVVAGAVLWILNAVYAKQPAWRRFEGSIISGIKFAEREIPEDSPNKSLSRLDAALRYVVKVYEEVARKRASTEVVADLKEGIQITHDDLVARGTLK